MSRRILLTASLSIIALLPAAAQSSKPSVMDIKHSITDPAIIYPESFENDTRKILEGWYMKTYTASDSRYETEQDPNVSDETITARLAALPTVIEMPFNQIVRSYIDRYTKRARPQVAAMLGLGLYYMPIFEQALEAKGLPLELKYLPVIESGLDPNAVSKHGAAGLWQFMPAAAKGLDMELNSLVDERRDPYVASERAAQFLKELYDAYGDWSLAIAAYNCGPGTLNKALRRAAGDSDIPMDFWAVYPYLPEETRGYVPMFIAANYVMNYYPKHNISPVLPTKPLVTDTIGINNRVHFNQISAVLNIPIDELRLLNPQFRQDIVPASPEKQYKLILPMQQVQAYIMSENDVLAYEAERYARRTTAEPGVSVAQENLVGEAIQPEVVDEVLPISEEDVQEIQAVRQKAQSAPASAAKTRTVTHRVAEGETLAAIATKYGTTAAEIKNDNNLRRNAVRPGMELTIKTSQPETATAAATPAQTTQPTQTAQPAQTAQTTQTSKQKQQQTAKQKQQQAAKAKPTSHTIKNGENLTTIAKKYGVSVDEIRRANNLSGDAIRAGKTLTIPAKKSAGSSKSKRRRR